MDDSEQNNVRSSITKVLPDLPDSILNKSKRVYETLTKSKFMRGSLEPGCTGDLKDMVLLLLSYFNKKEEDLFGYVEETCLASRDV